MSEFETPELKESVFEEPGVAASREMTCESESLKWKVDKQGLKLVWMMVDHKQGRKDIGLGWKTQSLEGVGEWRKIGKLKKENRYL